MKQIIKITTSNISKIGMFIMLISLGVFFSCEDNDLPETGSIPDLTPPEAKFTATQGIGSADEWKTYSFSNHGPSCFKSSRGYHKYYYKNYSWSNLRKA